MDNYRDSMYKLDIQLFASEEITIGSSTTVPETYLDSDEYSGTFGDASLYLVSKNSEDASFVLYVYAEHVLNSSTLTLAQGGSTLDTNSSATEGTHEIDITGLSPDTEYTLIFDFAFETLQPPGSPSEETDSVSITFTTEAEEVQTNNLYSGSSSITKMYVGSSEVAKVYVGSTKIYDNAGEAETYTVTLDSINSSSDITVEYSIDNGSTWTETDLDETIEGISQIKFRASYSNPSSPDVDFSIGDLSISTACFESDSKESSNYVLTENTTFTGEYNMGYDICPPDGHSPISPSPR